MKCFKKMLLFLLGSGIIGLLSFGFHGNSPQSTQKGKHFSQDLYNVMKWRCIGPYRGGRVDAVTGVPGQPYLYYFGAVGGGCPKSSFS